MEWAKAESRDRCVVESRENSPVVVSWNGQEFAQEQAAKSRVDDTENSLDSRFRKVGEQRRKCSLNCVET